MFLINETVADDICIIGVLLVVATDEEDCIMGIGLTIFNSLLQA